MTFNAREAFLSPGDEFSPMPFWFWNDHLTPAELTRQMEDFHAHGVAGFVLHPRKGLPRSIPYLSDIYMDMVRHALSEARRLGMKVVLYDEGMYPSGSAHGMVAAANPAWASRCLWMETPAQCVPHTDDIVAVCAARAEDGRFSCITAVSPVDGFYPVPDDGRQLLVFRQGFSGGSIRGVHEDEDDGEPLAPPSADLLNPDAVQCFIRLTHERYFAAAGEFFGNVVMAMFTDEPDIVGRGARRDAIAWTWDFLPEYGAAEELPALFADAGNNTQALRLRYRRAINARLLRTYYQPLSDWCGAHGIALTGHPAKGWDIGLLSPFQIPGQDVVWRFVTPGDGVTGDESVLGKCAADAARHRLRRRCANECFGCCGPAVSQWAMTPADLKWYMDYLFVRGVNLLFPHAFYYSVRDGRGNERPPDVGPNNTFWPEYGRFAAYMRRLSWLMTDSVNQARIAVICLQDQLPWRCCIPLYERQQEFNYLEADLLTSCRVEDGCLCIAHQRYTHILLDDLPLTEAQQEVLTRFAASGGRVVRTADDCPAGPVAAPAAGLRLSHVIRDGLHLLLAVNESDAPLCTHLVPPVDGAAEWWDAWAGSTAPAIPEEAGYPLYLDPRESRILAIDPAADPAEPAPAAPQPIPMPLPSLSWRLTRPDGATHTLVPDAHGFLPGWESIPGWASYSGMVTYESDVTIQPGGMLTDLGEIHEVVRVYANGVHIGTRLWGPYIFPLPEGSLHLKLEIFNTPAARMDNVPLPSGLCRAAPAGGSRLG